MVVEKGSDGAAMLHALRVSRQDFLAWGTEHRSDVPWRFAANERREELLKIRFLVHYQSR